MAHSCTNASCTSGCCSSNQVFTSCRYEGKISNRSQRPNSICLVDRCLSFSAMSQFRSWTSWQRHLELVLSPCTYWRYLSTCKYCAPGESTRFVLLIGMSLVKGGMTDGVESNAGDVQSPLKM